MVAGVLLALCGALLWGCGDDGGWVSYGAGGTTRAVGDGGATGYHRKLAAPKYAGSIGVSGDGCAALELRASPTKRVGDVVFVIDNSGSMADEIQIVQQRMNAFSQQIAEADVDAHIVLISKEQGAPLDLASGESLQLGICIAPPLGSGTCPDDSNAPGYLHLYREVGSNDALELLLALYDDWSSVLRPQAETAFVVISDDDAMLGFEPSKGAVAQAFMDQLAGRDPALAERLRFHGIFSRTRCAQAAAIGEVYEQLVRRTGGVAGDLCRRDFQRVFDAIAESVVAGATLGCEWDIPPPPDGEELLFGQVAVRYTPSDTGEPEVLPRVTDAAGCATADGWHYDDPDSPTRVALCRTTCDRLRHDPEPAVDLVFGCDELPQPD